MTIRCVKVWDGDALHERTVLSVGVDDAIDDALTLFNDEDSARSWTRAFIHSVVPVFSVDSVSSALYKELIPV